MATLLFAPNEVQGVERRTALTPATVRKLKGLGIDVRIEAGLGGSSDFSDDIYLAEGAEKVGREQGLKSGGSGILCEPAGTGGNPVDEARVDAFGIPRTLPCASGRRRGTD